MFTIENNIIKGVERKFNLYNKNVGQIIINKFNDNPNHVAQIEAETGKQTTLKEMLDSIIRCALWIQKQKIKSDDVITICTHNHLDAYIPCIATFFVRAIYNPWHHEVSLMSARHFMSLTRPKIIFSCESAVNVLKEAARLEKVDTRIIVFGEYPEETSLKKIMKLQTEEEVRMFQPLTVEDLNDAAMIFFSSGTTGLAKGVIHSYKTLLNYVIHYTDMKIKKIDVCVWYSSLYWSNVTFYMLRCMLTTVTRIVHTKFNPEETCEIIEKFQVSALIFPPTTFTHWYKSNVLKKYKLEYLERIYTGGAKLRREMLKDLKNKLPHVEVILGYGMTEHGYIVTSQTKECKEIDSVGFVLPNTQLKIIDVRTGEVLGPNQPGEICIKSPAVMVGYYKNDEATKATIDNEGWLHSGDKAYYAENGEVFIIDRLKEIMKFRSHHISPFEIEDVLMSHPAIMEAAVVPIPHELDLERPMAFIKKVPGAKVTEEELIELSSTLGDHKKLSGGIKFLDEMPYTLSGKIDRKYLKEMAKSFVKDSLHEE